MVKPTHALGRPTTWLEIVAVVIALAMVGCNIREIHWGWPLAIISSVMYFALFWRSKLYGEACAAGVLCGGGVLGLVPVVAGTQCDGAALHVARLSRQWPDAITWLASALLWPLTGLFLKNTTDTDVPWWDAFSPR